MSHDATSVNNNNNNNNNNNAITNKKNDFDDFFMPAEWAPHAACLMVYPLCGFTFCLPKAQREFIQIAQAIANEGDEPVLVYCSSQEIADQLIQTIACSNIHVRVCPTNDSWNRDIGPTFVIPKTATSTAVNTMVGVDWDFNAWGGPLEGCYWPCDLDQLAAQSMCRDLNDPIIRDKLHFSKTTTITARKVNLILEGGSIHVDGQGTLLTSQECLLNPNRNPHYTQDQIEDFLKNHLAVTKIIWLPFGVDGDDDTNGHIDNFACFGPGPGQVILSWTDDNVNDAINYQRCREALEILEQTTDAQGRRLTIHKLPLPPPMFYTQQQVDSLNLYEGQPPRQVGQRMAGSYVNFYIANKAVIVPQFGRDLDNHNGSSSNDELSPLKAADQQAVEILAGLFIDRKVVGVPSKQILVGGGNIHCITQQVPIPDTK